MSVVERKDDVQESQANTCDISSNTDTPLSAGISGSHSSVTIPIRGCAGR